MARFTRTQYILIVVVVVVVLGAVVAVAAYFLLGISPISISKPPLLAKGEYFELASISQPFSGAVSIDAQSGVVTPLSVHGQGVGYLLSANPGANSTPAYYLISPNLQTTSNIYKEDTAHPNTGLFQLTFSPTFKYNFSYDAPSGSAAYVVGSASTQPHIMFYSPLAKKETDLGAGTNPSLLEGGFFVIFQQGSNLVSENVLTQKAYTLLTVGSTTPFAIDPVSGEVALYVPEVQSIMYFSIANKMTAGYLSSAKVTSAPTALAFGDGKLFMLTTAVTAKGTRGPVIQQVGASASSALDISKQLTGTNYRLSIQHD